MDLTVPQARWLERAHIKAEWFDGDRVCRLSGRYPALAAGLRCEEV